MQKKEYLSPTIDVVELKQQQHLLAGSDAQPDVQNYFWNNVPEE